MVVTYGLAASPDQLVIMGILASMAVRLLRCLGFAWIGTGCHLNCIRLTASLVSVLFGQTYQAPSLKPDMAIPSLR